MNFGFSKQNPFANGGFNSPNFNNNQYNANTFTANNIIQNFGFNDTASQLQSMLTQCSYHPQHCYSVFDSVNKLAYIHPQLKPDILKFKDNFGVKSLIQLQGVLQVNFHGEKTSVSINIMFPEKYPQQPPNIRIINTNPQATETTPHYQVFESANYPNSYVISNMLSTVEQWNQNSNIVDVVREAESLMSNKFPFKKIKSGHNNKHMSYTTKNSGGSGGSNSNSGFNSSGYSPHHNNNQGFNNQGFNSGYSGEAFNNNNSNNSSDESWDWDNYNNNGKNNNNNNGGWNNWNNGTNNNNNNNWNNNNNGSNFNNNNFNSFNNNKTSNQPQPQNTKKWTEQQQFAKDKLDDYTTRCTNFAVQSKKMADKLLAQKLKDFQAIQQLQPIVVNLKMQKQPLESRTKSMIKFIRQNQTIEQIDLKKLFTPKDQYSSQLLELVSINKAASDTLDQIERYFSEGKISLDQLLKLTRKIEQEKFMSRVMIKKKLEKQL